MKFKNQKGQGMIEYLILVALMAVASIGIVRVLNQTINAKFTDITFALQGSKKRVEKEAPTERLYRKKDMRSFLNGAASDEK